MRTISWTLPKQTLVMTDGGDDAGMWLSGLTDLTPVVPNGFEFGTLSLPLLVALSNACSDPAFAVEQLDKVHTDVIFVGAHRIAMPEYPWDVSCIASLPDVHLIASAPWGDTEAAAFAVTR
jgi:hypothetical protein